MPSTSADTADLDDRCISFKEATPGQRTQALFWVAQHLDGQFSHLSLGEWARAFTSFKPDLCEEGTSVSLYQEDLDQFTDYLASLVPARDAPGCPAARYLAQRSVSLSREAARVLVDLEASPLADYTRLVHLVECLADGNRVADRVLRLMKAEPQRESTEQPETEQPETEQPETEQPAAADAA